MRPAFGERWKARCGQPVSAGDTVRVAGVEGLTVNVELTGGDGQAGA